MVELAKWWNNWKAGWEYDNERRLFLKRAAITVASMGMLALPGCRAVTETEEKEIENISKMIKERYGTEIDFSPLTKEETGKEILSDEVPARLKLKAINKIVTAISRYPPNYMRKIGTEKIRCVKDIRFKDENWGGFAKGNAIYIEYNGISDTLSVFVDSIRTGIDHELFHKAKDTQDPPALAECQSIFRENNPQGFLYLSQEGKTYFKNMEYAEEKFNRNSSCFIEPYCVASFEEDEATSFEWAMDKKVGSVRSEHIKNKMMAVRKIFKNVAGNELPWNYWNDLLNGRVDWNYWKT